MFFVVNQLLVASMDLTAYKAVPIMVSIDYFIEGSPSASSCYQNHSQINRNVGEEVVRVTNAPDLSHLRTWGTDQSRLQFPLRFHAFAPFPRNIPWATGSHSSQ